MAKKPPHHKKKKKKKREKKNHGQKDKKKKECTEQRRDITTNLPVKPFSNENKKNPLCRPLHATKLAKHIRTVFQKKKQSKPFLYNKSRPINDSTSLF